MELTCNSWAIIGYSGLIKGLEVQWRQRGEWTGGYGHGTDVPVCCMESDRNYASSDSHCLIEKATHMLCQHETRDDQNIMSNFKNDEILILTEV